MHRHFWKVSVDEYGDYVFKCTCGEFYEVRRKEYWGRTPWNWHWVSMFHYKPNKYGIYVKPAETRKKQTFIEMLCEWMKHG